MDFNGFYLSFFDILILVPMGFAIWRGFRNGIIPEALSFAAFLLMVYIYVRVTDVPGLLWTKDVAKTLIYLPVVIFTMVLCGIIFLTHLIEKFIHGQTDQLEVKTVGHVVGIMIAIVRYTFVISCVLIIFDKVDEKYSLLSEEERNGSYFYKPMIKVAPSFYPYLSFDNIKNTNYIDTVKNSTLKYVGGDIPIRRSLERLKGSADGSILWTSYKAENWETNSNLVIVESTVVNRDGQVYQTGQFKFLYNKRTQDVKLYEYYFNEKKSTAFEAFKTLKRGSFTQ
jgi:membrane protein required for colicin V production